MIKIRGLYKSFRGNLVLKGTDLDIKEGETITIIGGSGCGKTVLLKHIVGLLKPDSGEIHVDNQEITKLEGKQLWELQKKFGYLFQGAALFDSMTVEENVAFGLRNSKFPEKEIRKKVDQQLAHVGLEGTNNLKPAELSGGMRKRVGLARAIARDPEYILYDEPTTGLDPITADTINDLIIHLQKTLNVTSIVVTHDMKSASKVSDKIAMLHQGKIIAVGKTKEIMNSEIAEVKQFIQSFFVS